MADIICSARHALDVKCMQSLFAVFKLDFKYQSDVTYWTYIINLIIFPNLISDAQCTFSTKYLEHFYADEYAIKSQSILC